MVYQKSEEALPALVVLRELLCFNTKDHEKDEISLEKNIGYYESLIALEKLRIKSPELINFEKDLANPN